MMSDGQLLARWTEKFTNTHKKKRPAGAGASPGSWLASIICLSPAARACILLPLARELELKCWHTSCIMWHWSDERSLPKSSTLSGAELQSRPSRPLAFLERRTMWLASLGMGESLGCTSQRDSHSGSNTNNQLWRFLSDVAFWIGNACVQGFASTPETLSFYECELIFVEWDAPRRVCESVFTNVATGVCGTEMLWQICILDIYFPFTVSSTLISYNFTNGGASCCRYGDNAGVCEWRRRRDIS